MFYVEFRDKCLGHVQLCTNGFSSIMWLKIDPASFVASGSKYIMCGGGHTGGTSRGGIVIIVMNSKLYVEVC